MELRVAAMEEPHQPPDRQTNVERHIRHVEHRDEATAPQQERLEIRLHVDVETSLERHDPLCVLGCSPVSLFVDDRSPDEQIRRVDPEPDRRLPPSGETA
jgi:hypothetical protein